MRISKQLNNKLKQTVREWECGTAAIRTHIYADVQQNDVGLLVFAQNSQQLSRLVSYGCGTLNNVEENILGLLQLPHIYANLREKLLTLIINSVIHL